MFPLKIKELRLSKKMTQQEIANKLGITRPAYTAYENGKREPDFTILQSLAEIFEVSTDYLLGRKENQDNRSANTYTDTDLDNMIDNAMSFDGEPISDHDREVIRAYLKGKYGK